MIKLTKNTFHSALTKPKKNKKFKKLSLAPAVLTIGLLSVFLGLAILVLIISSMLNIESLAINTRDSILPNIIDRQRTAINIEKLSRLGEIVVVSSNKASRREARLVAQALSNDSGAYEDDSVLREKIKKIFNIIKLISNNKDTQDELKESISQKISEIKRIIESSENLSKSEIAVKFCILQTMLFEASSEESFEKLKTIKINCEKIIESIISFDEVLKLVNPIIFNGILEIFSIRETIIKIEKDNLIFWSEAKKNLSELSDNLSMSASSVASNNFTHIYSNAKQAANTGLIGLSLGILFIIHLAYLTRKYIIMPIIKITKELKGIKNQAKSLEFEPAKIHEIDSIMNATKQLREVVEDLKESKHELSLKNSDLKTTNQILKEANRKIVEGIQYAKLIQTSILPDIKQIENYLPESFFIWMPKDLVGGDIFFADFFENEFVIAVFDCTGHGVSGAFMTMITASSLRRIIKDENCKEPGEILKRLNFMVKTLLHQDKNRSAISDNGLDGAICVINKQTLTFAGARLHLYYSQDGNVEVIKGDKQSIGYRNSDLNFNFTNHVINLNPNICFYMLTDGFTDQLGGNNQISFGSKRFKKLIQESAYLSFEKQREKFVETFLKYKGNNEIQDDVTVVGFCCS